MAKKKTYEYPQTGVFVDVATGSYYEDAVDCAVLFSLQETN